MSTIDTGLGGEVSIELGALTVAVGSSLLLLVFFLMLGRDPVTSVVEVTLSGVVLGTAYYLGLRARS